jgi:hypothetical protein
MQRCKPISFAAHLSKLPCLMHAHTAPKQPALCYALIAAPPTTLQMLSWNCSQDPVAHKPVLHVVQDFNKEWSITPYGVLTTSGWGWGEDGGKVGVRNDCSSALVSHADLSCRCQPCMLGSWWCLASSLRTCALSCTHSVIVLPR